MLRQLPPSPSLEQLKKQAKSLFKRLEAADPEASARIRENRSARPGCCQPGLFPRDAEAWQTPLAFAVTRGREEVVQLLVKRGAVRTSRSPEGETPSEVAQKTGHREIALIRDGATGRDEARGWINRQSARTVRL